MFLQSNPAKAIARFARGESGAVTVDWVVLTAAVAGLGIGAATLVRAGTSDVGTDISTSLSGTQIASLDCLGANGGPAGFECYDGPTITSAGFIAYFMTPGYCWMSLDGTSGCSPGSSGTQQTFQMSDGSTYTQRITTANGETVTTWTDNQGNPVDEPPPMDDSVRNNGGCWTTDDGLMVCA